MDSLKKKGNFILLAVDASPDLRYERIVLRNSETDRISFPTFLANEKREMDSDDPNKQNLRRCIEMADVVFNNDSTIEDLIRDVKEMLSAYTL